MKFVAAFAIAASLLPSALAQIPSIPQCGVWARGATKPADVVYAADIQGCVNLCSGWGYCISSEYNTVTRQCRIYAQPLYVRETIPDNSGEWIINDIGCPIPLCRVYGDGNQNYTSFQTGTAQECATACRRDGTQCLAWQYRATTTTCRLFVDQIPYSKTSDDPTKSAVFFDKSCTDTVQCAVYADTDNEYIRKIPSQTLRQCQEACRAELTCGSFEYRANNKNCWLFRRSVAEEKTSSPATDATKIWVMYDRDCATVN